MKTLTHLSDDELLSGLQGAVGSIRQITARLISYLAEVEARRLHLKWAYSSMFELCTERLGMSEGEAFRRIVAARLVARFPVIYQLVESGAIHLSALSLLRDHLTEENHAELLREASGKTKHEVEASLARRFPKPDAASRIRKLAERSEHLSPAESGEVDAASGESARPPPVTTNKAQSFRFQPLSDARYKVEFTADSALKEKLERAKNLLSHANPSGDLAVVVDRALDLLLSDLEKKKLGRAIRPGRPRAAKPGAVTRAARCAPRSLRARRGSMQLRR